MAGAIHVVAQNTGSFQAMRSISQTMERARQLMDKIESNGLELNFRAKGGARKLLNSLGLNSDELTITIKVPGEDKK